uniref:Translation initiation factor eIF2B subunit delta n=1 Tax=Elaeophora elaphi TaxID=1147741 RepID=A0A0R3S068_9BILA
MDVGGRNKKKAFSDQVSNPEGVRADTVATEVVRLFDVAVDCLRICLSLLSINDMDHRSDAKKKLAMEFENLQIDDKTDKASSSKPSETPGRLEQLGNGQDTKEEIRMKRKAKAAEAKARKIVAAKAKKTLKQNNALANGETSEKTVNEERECSSSGGTEQKRTNPFRLMKDPGLPSAFRSSQPFKAVHFGTDISVFILPNCRINPIAKTSEKDEGSSKEAPFCEMITSNIHPSFLEFASRCEAKRIVGVDAVCVAFVQSFKQFLSDYVIPTNQVMPRDLEQAIQQQINCLTEHGKHSFPLILGNLVKQLKKEISQLPDSVSEQKVLFLMGKERLYCWLDDFVQQNFELALRAISSFCLRKMKNIVFVLTYSWCPVVERIILDAHKDKQLFHVFVLDSPIEHKGRQLVKTLCARNIQCSYGMLSSVGYLMKECDIVLLGCSAILSNGFVVAERGTGQIALVASASNIPVLVAAQTCKFVDRASSVSIYIDEYCLQVQSFSHGIHEVSALMGDRNEVVAADLITALVTELRILPPSSAPAVLKAKQLAVDS